MNRFQSFINSLTEEVAQVGHNKFVARKGQEKIQIDARSDGGLTVTVLSGGRSTVYVFDAGEMNELQMWLKKAA